MHLLKHSFARTIALSSLVSIATCLMPARDSAVTAGVAHANPQPIKQPFLISRLLPKKTAFDCGNMGAITLTREPVNRDRFTYEAINTRGQTLTIKDGVGYGDNKSTIYTFRGQGGSEFIVEEFPTGKATLTTSSKDIKPTSFNCTVVKAAGTASSGSATRSSSGTSSESSSTVRETRTSETRTTTVRTRSVVRPTPKLAPPPTTGEVRGLW